MGQKDSNLRITEPKPAALPLGYAPDFISIMVFFRAKVNGCPKREQPKKVSFTNLIYVLLEGDIGVPFRVIHDVKDQNHDRSLLVDPFLHNGYVSVPVNYYAVSPGIGGE